VSGTLYLGTSGFAYDEWKGVFYPEGTKNAGMLPYYSGRFNSVEINYTFRRLPSEKTIATWKEVTPEGFRFTLKAHQRITHSLRLKDTDEQVGTFIERARLLGDRMGPILFQCPPNLKFDRGLIENFVAYLPPIARYTMEFRHPSWLEAREILSNNGVSLCTAETDEHDAGDPSWEPFGYLRLRKTGYSDDELRTWAGRIRSALRDGHDVYCYFKHESEGAAPAFAEKLSSLIPD
jgi:uncharacterized protein YecE (DUF72 family)